MEPSGSDYWSGFVNGVAVVSVLWIVMNLLYWMSR
jgi:hypothetical protein